MYNHRGWSYSSSVHQTPTNMSAYRRRRLPRFPRFPSVGPLPFAVLIVGAAAWYHFGFAGFTVHGSLVDASTGQPISGARAWSTHSNAVTDASGAFALANIKPP